MNREGRREQQRNNPNCIYCNSPIGQPHQQELHEQTSCALRQKIAEQATIIDALLDLLDRSNTKRLENLKQLADLLMYGERGAEENFAELSERLGKAERERDFYKGLLNELEERKLNNGRFNSGCNQS